MLDGNMHEITSMMNRQQMKIELDKYNYNKNNESLNFVSNLIKIIKTDNSGYNAIYILNLKGDVVASTDNKTIGMDLSSEEFFIKGKEKQDVTIFSRDKYGNLIRYFAGPLVLNETTIGVVVVQSNMEKLLEITSDQAGLGETGEIRIAKRDKNGDALFIHPLRFDAEVALNTRIDKDRTDLPIIQALSKNEAFFAETKDYQNKSVIAVTRYIKSVDWGMVVKIDKNEVFLPIDNLRNQTLILALFIFLISGSIVLIALRYITNPIVKLTKNLESISKGNLDITIDSKLKEREDEIGALTRAFDRTLVSLKISMKRAK